MSEPTPRTDWRLEKLAAEGGAPASPADAEKLARLQASDAEILAEHPPAKVTAEVRRRLQAKKRSWTFMLAIPAMAAAVFLLVPRTTPEEPTERIKGDPHLLVFRQIQSGQEQLAPDAPAKPGEVIQLRAVTGGQRYGVIFSLDGRGAVTLHYPEEASGSTSLTPGDMALPHAYQLDDAPSFERFFFITSEKPLDVSALLSSARTLAAAPDRARRAPLPAVDVRHQSSLLLQKVTP